MKVEHDLREHLAIAAGVIVDRIAFPQLDFKSFTTKDALGTSRSRTDLSASVRIAVTLEDRCRDNSPLSADVIVKQMTAALAATTGLRLDHGGGDERNFQRRPCQLLPKTYH